MSSDGTHVWVANFGENTVSEIEASSGTVIHTIPVGRNPMVVSSDGTHVWVGNFDEKTVSEIPTSYTPECTGNSGTVTLNPGLTDTAAAQTMKIKGTLTGCQGTPFKDVKYTATLTTAAVSCSVLTGAGATATGAATYKWTPKPKKGTASTGTLSMPLAETAGIVFSAEVTSGSYSPLTLTGTASESYAGGATCGQKAKALKKGTFSGVISSISR